MKNRTLSKLGLFVLGNLSVFFSQEKEKPNVIITYADDIRSGDLSCYGSTIIHAPHTDAVASSGIHFTNAHAIIVTSTPSRYSLLTGECAWRDKYPEKTSWFETALQKIRKTPNTRIKTILQKKSDENT